MRLLWASIVLLEVYWVESAIFKRQTSFRGCEVPNISNGAIAIGIQEYSPGEEVPNSYLVDVICKEGFALIGGDKENKNKCIRGAWIKPFTQCQEMATSTHPPLMRDSETVGTFNWDAFEKNQRKKNETKDTQDRTDNQNNRKVSALAPQSSQASQSPQDSADDTYHADCIVPSHQHGFITINSIIMHVGKMIAHDIVVGVVCSSGYFLDLETTKDNRIKCRDGNWNKKFPLCEDFSNDDVLISSSTSESPQVSQFYRPEQNRFPTFSQNSQPSQNSQSSQQNHNNFNFGPLTSGVRTTSRVQTHSGDETFSRPQMTRHPDICHKPNILNGQVISRDRPNIQRNHADDGEAVYVYCNRFLLNLERSGNNMVVCRAGVWIGTFADCKELVPNERRTR